MGASGVLIFYDQEGIKWMNIDDPLHSKELLRDDGEHSDSPCRSFSFLNITDLLSENY